MLIRRHERIAAFIDGPNLSLAAKSIRLEIDFRRLRDFLATKGNLVRIYYYTPIIEEQEYSSVRPLVDWLAFNGFATRTKMVRERVDDAGRRKIKGSMSVDLAIDAVNVATSLDHIVLFTGDGDYSPLVEWLQFKGCRVTVVSTLISTPPMVSDNLRRAADEFVELDSLRPLISRQVDSSVRTVRSGGSTSSEYLSDIRE